MAPELLKPICNPANTFGAVPTRIGLEKVSPAFVDCTKYTWDPAAEIIAISILLFTSTAMTGGLDTLPKIVGGGAAVAMIADRAATTASNNARNAADGIVGQKNIFFIGSAAVLFAFIFPQVKEMDSEL